MTNWQEALAELNSYVSAHPDVCIGKSSISIADTCKSEFYRLFDGAREALARDLGGQYLAQAESLSRNYALTQHKLCGNRFNMRRLPFRPGAGKLDRIVLGDELDEYLKAPLLSLRRALFDPLFSLLQGKMTLAVFEQAAGEGMRASFRRLQGAGYQIWLGFNLLDQLKADRYFNIEKKGITHQKLIKRRMAGLELADSLPPPGKTRAINLSREQTELPTIVPVDILARSSQTKGYVGLKFGLEEACFSVTNAGSQRPWLPPEKAGAYLGSNSLLIYLAADAPSASLVADDTRVWRPDMVIEFADGACDTAQKAGRCSRELQPARGIFIVPIPPAAEHQSINADSVPVISAGFDAANLKQIVSKLALQDELPAR